VDGDGDLDLFVTNHELETHTLFRNMGKGLFSEITAEAGLATPTLPFVGFGTAFFDADNDGAVANGHVAAPRAPASA
jgi:enediyne biosynthesis protein E4